MQLVLIRHPRPVVASGVCYGVTDLELAEPAQAAAQRIRPQLLMLSPEGIAVYTSPLQRCRLLAEALHPAPIGDMRLREMDFGDWEMQPWRAIGRAELDRWAADPLGFRPPNGETAGGFRHRVLDFVAGLQRAGVERAALVAHAGVLKVLAGAARRLPDREWMALHFDFECVLLLDGLDTASALAECSDDR